MSDSGPTRDPDPDGFIMLTKRKRNLKDPLTDPKKKRNSKTNSDTENSDMEEECETINSRRKPAPIVIKANDLDHNNMIKLTQEIRSILPNTMVKHSRATFTIYPYTTIDHKNIEAHLQKKNIPYHTYTQPEIKEKKFVIKGLPRIAAEHIIEELKLQGVEPIKISEMKTKKGIQTMYPFYYLSVAANTDVNAVYKIRHIEAYIVRIERFVSTRQGTQCYNCQEFGHGSSNCHRK
ncbi:uncharacterized protein LOC103576134 [Microplitis demolitor]|uniref:uncharacterized protein LOC103576134 n=1 Tax=Microplitis demolitor TaxID=69319 RepID=UPI0004CDCB20|nr:uncharacterized protein LOC103576134 [Microplitis demolitor]